MKSPLWSKIIGVVIGMLVGAGVVYATGTIYDYTVTRPATVVVGGYSVGASAGASVVTAPGLQAGQESLDFGAIAPGTYSQVVHLIVTNVGQDDIVGSGSEPWKGLSVSVANRPTDMRFWARWLGGGATGWVHEAIGTDPIIFVAGSTLPAGGTADLEFKVYVPDTLSAGSYSFDIQVYWTK